VKAVTQAQIRDLGRIKIGRLGKESAEERDKVLERRQNNWRMEVT
jgi:hypothetical protein